MLLCRSGEAHESRPLYPRLYQQGQETANQLHELRKLCIAQGWTIVSEYEDHESGGKADRSQFKAMMTDAARRKFDVVLLWALDRFSREGVYETHVHLKRLDVAGVRFRSFTERTWIRAECFAMR